MSLLWILSATGTVKGDAKGDICTVSTGWCDVQAKHYFSWGNVSRVLNFITYWHSFITIFPRLKSPKPSPVGASKV
jgi:hypothetical protein